MNEAIDPILFLFKKKGIPTHEVIHIKQYAHGHILGHNFIMFVILALIHSDHIFSGVVTSAVQLF